MTESAKALLRLIGLFASVLLAIGACCMSVRAGVILPDGTKAGSLLDKAPAIGDGYRLLEEVRSSTADGWQVKLHFNDGDEGIVKEISGDNICGYGVSVIVPRVEASLQEMLDAKHLAIIEVNLVRFTDVEPWNAYEPDVQSIYFVVNPEDNNGDAMISWRSPETDVNLAQGFRLTGTRCCFSLSVNSITGYLYAPGVGGEGIARKHIGFDDNVLLIDDYLNEKVERIIQQF